MKSAQGEWITAAPVPGTFVCNVGDMLRIYSNGALTPPLHETQGLMCGGLHAMVLLVALIRIWRATKKLDPGWIRDSRRKLCSSRQQPKPARSPPVGDHSGVLM